MAAKKKGARRKSAPRTKQAAAKPRKVVTVRAAGVTLTVPREARVSILLERAIALRLARLISRLDTLLHSLKAHLFVVCFHTKDCADSQPTLKKSRGDAIAWKNEDDHPIRISFKGTCPVQGFPNGGLTLAPGENSDAYVVADVADDWYTCQVDPPYIKAGGGPDEPVIIVEG